MKKLLIQGVGLLMLAEILAGCQTAMQTASGKPEITIHNGNADVIRATATSYFRDQGYVPAKVDEMGVLRPVKENDMVFEKPHHQATNFIGVPSTSRILVTIDNTRADGVTVLRGDAFTVGNSHTAFENVVPAPGDYGLLQAGLQNIGSDLQSGRTGGTAHVASAQVVY